jgi:transposase
MSLNAPLAYSIPDATDALARKVFPKGNLYMTMRGEFGPLYQNADFADLFPRRGQPALAPAQLLLVLVMQFVEGLSDEQAADAVRSRIDWKYALALELDDTGFDASVLSEFRDRLLTHQAEQRLLDQMLSLLRARGLLKARGRQRTDSTHVLGAIRGLYRLENIGEALRQALNHLVVVAPTWLRAVMDASWSDRYATRIEQYRLPKEETKRQELALIFATDGYQLLDHIYQPSAPGWLREIPAVETLRRVWVQQFYRSDLPDEPIRLRGKDERPPSALLISSPYDPEARWCTKRETTWVGYRAHLTETCDDDLPHLITHVATTPATTIDVAMTATIQAELAAKDLLPAEHIVDSGYIDAELLVTSMREHTINLLGPVIHDPSWQAKESPGFTAAQFALDWDAEQARCPQGKVSRQWTPGVDGEGNPSIHIAFHPKDCRPCPCRAQCTKAKVGARGITIRPQEQHEAIQAARARQQTPEFKQQYAKRAGIEGTISQGVRRSDLRRARYIGLAKTRLQHLLMAVALNLVRVVAWLREQPRAQTRTSRFAAFARAGT